MTWFEYLDVAAQNLATCDLIDRELALQLVSLGRRKSTFLYPNNNNRNDSGQRDLNRKIPAPKERIRAFGY
jgi:hypothetical protein